MASISSISFPQLSFHPWISTWTGSTIVLPKNYHEINPQSSFAWATSQLADFMLLWHDTITTSFQMFHETADKLNSKLPKKWTKLFSSKYSLSGGLIRINLLLQFLLMWLGLLCFPAWICIPWNFIKASATLKSKWKDLAFSKSSEHKLCCLQQQSPQQLMVEVGATNQEQMIRSIIPWQIKALYKREYEPCSRHLANWPGKFLLWWLKDVKSCHQEQDETCQHKMDWIHLWA